MTAVDVEAFIASTHAMLEGHFKLASGRHSQRYIEKFRIMEDPVATVGLCGMIADYFRSAEPTVVVGPAMGGVILAFETARALGVRAIFTEKDPAGRHMFDRGFQVKPDDRVLVVDDVLTTGGSVRQVLDLLSRMDRKAIGIGFLIDRAGGKVEFGIPYFTCQQFSFESYDPASCPLCDKGLPLVET
ncbi:MAG TPA: orotate phosphoribosyltransferase [Dehalococcoidia bacterium]